MPCIGRQDVTKRLTSKKESKLLLSFLLVRNGAEKKYALFLFAASSLRADAYWARNDGRQTNLRFFKYSTSRKAPEYERKTWQSYIYASNPICLECTFRYHRLVFFSSSFSTLEVTSIWHSIIRFIADGKIQFFCVQIYSKKYILCNISASINQTVSNRLHQPPLL